MDKKQPNKTRDNTGINVLLWVAMCVCIVMAPPLAFVFFILLLISMSNS